MKASEIHAVLKKNQMQKKPGLFEWAVYTGMFILAYVVFYTLMLRPGSDLSIHGTWAAEGDFLNPRTFLRHGAHPLWHGLVAAVMLLGTGTKVAAALVTAALKVTELWLVRRMMGWYLEEKWGQKAVTGMAVCCVLVMAVYVPWVNPTVYAGIGAANVWHSPTQMMAMVMMLLCVPYTAYCYAAFERLVPQNGEKTIIPWKKAIVLGILLLVSLTAKPTFMQAFLPAAGLFFLAQWIRHPKNSRFFGQMILAVLPSVLFMVLQYMYYFGLNISYERSMVLEISPEKWRQIGLATLMIQAFPLYALVTCAKREDFRNPLLTLTVLLDAVGVLEFALLGEGGYRAQDGNFGWAMMGGALMLWVLAIILFFNDFAKAREEGKKKLKYAGGILLLLWHLGAGIYYLVYLLSGSTNF